MTSSLILVCNRIYSYCEVRSHTGPYPSLQFQIKGVLRIVEPLTCLLMIGLAVLEGMAVVYISVHVISHWFALMKSG
jgi:hypothetical protein